MTTTLYKSQPFTSVDIEDSENTFPTVVYKNTQENICEYKDDPVMGTCDTTGLYYGTDDSHDPKFCARHYYQHVNDGLCSKLVDNK